ncbi:O-antigen polymerase [Luteococcus sp. H138]|uniref:O-antigen polymerase n=1 Tax=unclassified Luteococcus TaxID=2639923 RepID=UPI00406C4903
MAVGTLWLLRDPANHTPGYATVVAVPTCIYLVTGTLLCLADEKKGASHDKKGASHGVIGNSTTVQPIPLQHHPLLLSLFLLSLFITVAYYYTVGYNVLALGIKGMFTGVSEDYTNLRLESYSSNRYLFPGYVNQFKNIILPSLALVWIHGVIETRQRGARLTSVILVGVCILALLGTGQRGAFMLFSLAVLLFLYRLSPNRFRSRAPRFLGLVVPLMLVSTFLLGRSSAALSSATSLFGQAGVLFKELGKRFMYDNQWSGAMAYQYISMNPTQWGREWVQAISGILPSNPGSSLASDVFAYLYGTNRGTAPISMWGSVYYNFSWFGLLVFPVVLAIAWHKISSAQASSRPANGLEAVATTGFAAVAGMWAVGGPEYLLNAGAVAYGVLWWMGVRMRHAEGLVRPESTVRPKASLR